MAVPRLDASDVSRLIGLAYDAARDPEGWRQFSQVASETLDTRLALIMLFDHGDPDRSFVVAGGGIGDDFVAHFRSEWDPEQAAGEGDHLWDSVKDSRPGTVRCNHDFHSPDQIRGTEVYRRLGAQWKLDYLMMGVITNTVGLSAYITLARPMDADPFSRNERRLLRDGLLTHLRRSLSLHQSLEEARALNGALRTVTDMAPYGLVAFDRRGRALLVNRRAEEIFRSGHGLTLRGGTLCTPDSGVQVQLDWGLGIALAVAQGRLHQAPPAVHVPSPWIPGHEVVFAPVNPASEPAGLPGGAACVALIHETDAAPRRTGISGAITQIYGLTPAEIRVCEALYAGHTLPGAADFLGISRNTAKTHLGRVFDKTGVRSQIALLRLLAFGPPASDTLPAGNGQSTGRSHRLD